MTRDGDFGGPENRSLETIKDVYNEHVPELSREELIRLTPEELADYFSEASAGLTRVIEHIDKVLECDQ